MSRYIDADDAKSELTWLCIDSWIFSELVDFQAGRKDFDETANAIIKSVHNAIAEELDQIPTAEVKPIVYGEWIEHKNVEQANGETVYECSNCGVYSRKEFFCEKNFCPNCGAKMKKEREEEE